ncbi:hypothetical protein [Paraburkholderia sp. J10-1]|uniref:hypothetical protein n=1 Tax=Paraburkholderia sp. J10-1 TaxID=2805430 RepID=UPI002AB7C3CA|nr:hypothetical protein [Paraburkholderia sp. J10-1]
MNSLLRPPSRLKHHVPQPFWPVAKSIAIEGRPDLAAFADRLGCEYKPLDKELIEAIAFGQALLVERRDTDLAKHLQLWTERSPKVQLSKSFADFERAFSVPVYHLETKWGVVIAADASHRIYGVPFWATELLYLPWAIAECPEIAADLFLPQGDATLHVVLRRELSPEFGRYVGPGTPSVEGRKGFYSAAMRSYVVGNEREVLNSTLVADGLLEVLNDDFHMLFGEIVDRTVQLLYSSRLHGE